MKIRVSPTWFSIAFGLSYILIFARDWRLFLYYPLPRKFSLVRLSGDVGPDMHWYGFFASAAIVAAIVGLLCKDRWWPAKLRPWLWLAPLMTMVSITYLLKHFFI
jgi:hypothetical protein